MIGGHDGSTYLNSVERYDPKCDQWSCQVAAAGCSRTSVGVAVLGDCIYAVGGQDGSACLSLVERYVVIQAFVELWPIPTPIGTTQAPTSGSKCAP